MNRIISRTHQTSWERAFFANHSFSFPRQLSVDVRTFSLKAILTTWMPQEFELWHWFSRLIQQECNNNDTISLLNGEPYQILLFPSRFSNRETSSKLNILEERQEAWKWRQSIEGRRFPFVCKVSLWFSWHYVFPWYWWIPMFPLILGNSFPGERHRPCRCLPLPDPWPTNCRDHEHPAALHLLTNLPTFNGITKKISGRCKPPSQPFNEAIKP